MKKNQIKKCSCCRNLYTDSNAKLKDSFCCSACELSESLRAIAGEELLGK